ncbi:tRNA(His) guanylyltransferase [Galdieria sulphuraria]|uniref:tRNA(His) guanylyltransferase n=1 Tax=Galdieria sulphuraria TaxID=130081 RepID=M2X6N5_GALSU|nr:tRNA(His) guanylyltransferase [Galdieria sulphuraria]EME32180.1 tRNA(His) guanylyltransferase [Galdieria sulphuraria]|eukprot:XP_005708700.1 tRNA(His) guanylyltransferase [Galdieria sulphuraria]
MQVLSIVIHGEIPTLSSKILSCIVSLFSSAFVFYWKTFFEDMEMKYPPSFDGRVIIYPSEQTLRDYLSWRQVDCHVNNQYNTCFWLLVQNGATPKEAYETLKGTYSDFKNELLFQKFGINYSHIEARFRKGSTLFKKPRQVAMKGSKTVSEIFLTHEDIIRDEFWSKNKDLLEDR